MREFLLNLFKDDTFGPIISLYNITHIIFLILVVGLIVSLSIILSKKNNDTKKKILDYLTLALVILYFSDFFIHPFLNNGLDSGLNIDKLPFHLCTSQALLIGIIRLFKEKTKKWAHASYTLGLVGSFYYLIVPTGVNGDYLFCYRSLQTLIFHSLLMLICVLSIVFNEFEVDYKNLWITSVMVIIQILISIFANNAYSSESHHYDWYFTTGSLFGWNKYLMPFLVFICFIGTSAIIYSIVYLVKFIKNKKTTN